jgi:polysaccharide deacetylase
MRQKGLLPVSLSLSLGVLVALAPAGAAPVEQKPPVGSTRIARWQDNRKATFLLMFDDSWPSHWQVAAPELVKRGLIATFYLNPGKGEFQKFKDHWDKELWQQGMVYGDHTMTHKGVKDFENADWEIGQCANIIRRMVPDKDPHRPRLLSYAQPGVAQGAWNITDGQLNELLKKYHLVSRADAKGHMAVYHLKTAAEMLALADQAIEKGGVEYLIIHGVERVKPDWGYQDFWALKQDILLPVLDGLKERRDRGDLWITDHISAHQYEKERDGATVRTLEAGDRQIRLELTSTADPKFYDLPLTLVTQVPNAWRLAKATQGSREVAVKVKEGTAQFQAVPNGGPINVAAP